MPSPVMGAADPAEMHGLCSQATTFQTLQFVFFGLGAISAGAGVYLLATDRGGSPDAGASHAQRPTWSVTPTVGKSSGHLELLYAF